MALYKNFKIVLVGDGGVGKTTFVKRHRTGEFEQKYIATHGADIKNLTFNTNYGLIKFDVWDCAGQDNFDGSQKQYYYTADGAIAMFDLSRKPTFGNLSYWINNVRSIVPNIPVIICGNKSDLTDYNVAGRIEVEALYPNEKYFLVSSRSNYNYDKPFLELARKLTGHEDLQWEEMPPISPPKLNINCCVSDQQKTVSCVSDQQKTVSCVSDQQKTVSCVSDHQNTVSWVEIPGGMMKVTYKFYPCAKKL